MAPKNDPQNFLDLKKNSLAVMFNIFDLALRAIIDPFQTYTINSLIKKKKIR